MGRLIKPVKPTPENKTHNYILQWVQVPIKTHLNEEVNMPVGPSFSKTHHKEKVNKPESQSPNGT